MSWRGLSLEFRWYLYEFYLEGLFRAIGQATNTVLDTSGRVVIIGNNSNNHGETYRELLPNITHFGFPMFTVHPHPAGAEVQDRWIS